MNSKSAEKRDDSPPTQPAPTQSALASGVEQFHIGDDERYDRLKMIGWWDQTRLRHSRVLVVGAGALGNEVIKNLALVGIGHLLILDFDRIEASNLSRAVLFRAEHCGQSKAEVAAEMARQMNPDCHIVGRTADVTQDVGLGLIRDMDVVIGCVDNREARLWINRMCWKVGTPWVDGGIQEINGVAKTFVPPAGACYECTMTENDYRLMHLRYSCPLLKREDIQQGKVPTAPTIAALIGALQSQEALKILHGKVVGDGVGLVFNGDANRFYQTRFPRRENCLSHETYAQIVPLELSVQQTTARALLEMASEKLGFTVDSIELDRDFLLALACEHCQLLTPVNRPIAQVTLGDGKCPQCGLIRHPKIVCDIGIEDEAASQTLRQLGIPEYDIVKVKGAERKVQILLNADSQSVWGKPASGKDMVPHVG